MRVAMITPWGVKCGIASYAKSLVESVAGRGHRFLILGEHDTPPESTELYETRSCWRRYNPVLTDLAREIRAADVDVIHIQFQWFHSAEVLGEMLGDALDTGLPVIVQMHNTLPGGTTTALEQLVPVLARASSIVVHSEVDAERLRGLGLGGLVAIMPLGQPEYPDVPASVVRDAIGLESEGPVIGTFGYLLPHKGVSETIDAVALLKTRYPEILYLVASSIYPNRMCFEYLQECRLKIVELGLARNVVLITDYLEESVVMTLLSACDVLTLPYLPTTESASAATRFCLSAHRPIVVTRQEIFEAVADAVYPVDAATPEAIAGGVTALLDDDRLAASLVDAGTVLLASAGWSAIGALYDEMLNDVVAG